MKNAKAVVNAYPCDSDIMKKNSILFQFGREIAISEESQTELKLGLVLIPVMKVKYFACVPQPTWLFVP